MFKAKNMIKSNWNWLIFGVFVVCLLSSHVRGLDLQKCTTRPLGMESGELTDSQITASSSFDAQSVGPQNARIRTELNSGAWCPKQQIRNGSYEFLQVSFNSTQVIRAVETQGRYGNGTGREFATSYLIDYWRPGVAKWIRYRKRSGAQLIEANEDTITAVIHSLDPPLVASKVRIVPHSVQTRTTCMRVELYGCEYKDGLLSYAMSHLPSSSNSQEDFTDETFEQTDELDTVYQTQKGLGLLADGFIPAHPPIDPVYRLPFRNSTWVAWSQNETDGRVDIRFVFESKRHFSELEIYGYGVPCRQVEVEFSLDFGEEFQGHPIVSRYPDELTQSEGQKARHYSIRVPLNQEGQYVRVRFGFETDWLYLSELRFGTKDPEDGVSLLQDFTLSQGDYGLYYILVAVLSVMFILLTTALCVMISLRRSRHGKPKSEKSLLSSSLGSPSSRCTGVQSLSREMSKCPNAFITTLPHSSNGHPRHVIHSHSFAPHQGFLSQHKGSLFVATTEQRSSPSQRLLGVAPASRSCSGTLFNSMNRDHPPSLLDINFPPPPPSSTASTTRADGTTGPSNSSSEGIYAEPCNSTAPLLPNHHQSRSHRGTRRPIPKPRSRESLTRRNRTLPTRNRPFVDDPDQEPHYAVAHISSSSESHSPRPPPNHLRSFQDSLIDPPSHQRFIRRQNVQLVEKIGEGKFTHVYSCRVRDDTSGEQRWAAIKRLYMDNEAARLALIAEAECASRLSHPNMNALWGQCEDLSIVSELAVNGDLRTYCLKEREEGLGPSQMLAFCAEIATGMSYLEERGIVHGHLSPKCCLLTDKKQVRVGSARGPNHHAQLRYSSPEAIVLNLWSSRSDAYSFGMTVWELLQLCTRAPYQTLTNAELINNARNQLECSENSLYPDFPPDNVALDKEMADLLRECWSYPVDLRPGFREMQVFMSRKLLSLNSN